MWISKSHNNCWAEPNRDHAYEDVVHVKTNVIEFEAQTLEGRILKVHLLIVGRWQWVGDTPRSVCNLRALNVVTKQIGQVQVDTIGTPASLNWTSVANSP